MNPSQNLEIQFQPIGKRVQVSAGITLLEAARLAGIALTSICGGEGICGQCRVQVLSGEVSPITDEEKYALNDSEIKDGYRLACSTKAFGDVRLHVPKDSLDTGQRLQIESVLHPIFPDPLVKAVEVKCCPPSLQDPRSDWTRLQQELIAQTNIVEYGIPNSVVKTLPSVLRDSSWRVSVFLRKDEVISVLPGASKPLGLAVDLGTTKMAASLLDLESGQVLAASGAPNPQISYGEDVVSRLVYVKRNAEGGKKLAELVHQTINELLSEMEKALAVQPEQIAEACIVGNTAMSHLLLGWQVSQLAMSPYVAASSEAIEPFGSELGLNMSPGGRVYIPPAIGGYVGSDHVAMVLASELDQSDRISIGIDIGTNTEISLHIPHQNIHTAVSCASGPAFEGAHIRDGMRAASGAIEKVRITSRGVDISTIDNHPPIGFCGSGILDAIAELYRMGYLNSNGRFQRQKLERLGDSSELRYIFVGAEDSGNGREIAITQKDVNEIQLAKGAIQAGLDILLQVNHITPDQVEEVIIAGAFGSYIRLQSAIQIGLFPYFPKGRYHQVGNAAAVGAQWMLISKAARQRAEQIARNTHYLELTIVPNFNRQFAYAMQFPPLS